MLALLQNGAGYTHSGTGYAEVHDTDGATPSTITVFSGVQLQWLKVG